ncbi:DsrE family protein [Microvirga pakistanensis]|uniref:DsrE family protein n=1 Tax=Microvirga pakistanensis TaxID=1682650 RepID=UPI0010690E81|nr:DsrE family protein [Microvirga pakistanensis]
MPSLLVHVTCGPEKPTKATLAFFVAASVVEAGHEVHVVLAGDAVQLLREPVRNALTWLGTGALNEHYSKVIAGRGRLYLSGGSCAARGVTDEDIQDVLYEKGAPPTLVRLIMECDRNIVY